MWISYTRRLDISNKKVMYYFENNHAKWYIHMYREFFIQNDPIYRYITVSTSRIRHLEYIFKK